MSILHDPGARFATIFTEGNNAIIIDCVTKVQYLFCVRGYAGGISVMVDPNGKPLLFEGELPVDD